MKRVEDAAGPQGVRLHLDDGTRVPCRCRFIGYDEEGLAVWVAEPIEARPFPRVRTAILEVDVMPGESALILGHLPGDVH